MAYELRESNYIGLDIETYDPYLTTAGASWVFGEGSILCTALYYEDEDKVKVIPGADEEVKNVLLNPHNVLIGANIVYDIGWLEAVLGIKTRAMCYDIQMAEALIDEYGEFNLEALSKKYLGKGKEKSKLERWVEENGLKGDFRKHLKDAPFSLLKEYVSADAKYPVQIFRKQLAILKNYDLIEPFLIDCSLIPVVLGMKQRGIRIDMERKRESKRILERIVEDSRQKFIASYGDVNINSSKQLADLFDMLDIPVTYKITVKGIFSSGIHRIFSWETLKEDLSLVNQIARGFVNEKGKIVTYVTKEQALSIVDRLKAAGFVVVANPTIDKNVRNGLASEFPVVKLINSMKRAEDILSKFLGSEFDRFIAKDGRIHADFNISKSDQYGTVSGRFSSSMPNLQQIPSKDSITDIDGNELPLAQLCRSIFIPEPDHLLFKIDYSQIEFRLLVHFAKGPGAEYARRLYNENPHTDFHKMVQDISGLDRKYAKNLNFGVMYGMGIQRMMKFFGWDEQKAKSIYSQYRDAVPFVLHTMQVVQQVAIQRDSGKQRGYIVTVGKRKARLKSRDTAYTMLNRLNQGSAADIMKKAMVMAADNGLDEQLHIALTVHDELVGSFQETEKDKKALKTLKEIMETCYTLKVPLVAELEIGENWYDVAEYPL